MLRLAAPLASLFLLSGFAVAEIYAPDCSTSWRWSYNSLGQNACTVAAHLMSTCNGGSFTIKALDSGYHYTGPSGSDDADLCKCNTVTYSLLSACVACQGEEWISWPKYMHNCTKVLPASSFPNPVPHGTRVPYWALIDVTVKDTWEAFKAYTIGGTPEAGPGTLLGHPIRFINITEDLPGDTPKWTDSGVPPTTSPTCTSTRGSSLNGCGIGGVFVRRMAAFFIICAAIFYLRRRRPRAQSLVYMGDDIHHPQMEHTWKSPLDRTSVDTSTLTETLTSMTKPYKSKGSAPSDLV